ncbi:MAG: sensor histidine kinase [Vallitaleaceae bacterium]|nr:sensor histidine kinase [Vallitaleaceae bacterium]
MDIKNKALSSALKSFSIIMRFVLGDVESRTFLLECKRIKILPRGIRLKMLLSFSIVIVCSLLFVIYFSVSAYSEKLKSNNIRYSNQVISNLIGNLNNYIDEIEVVTNSIIYNYYIQSYLIVKGQPEREKNFGYDMTTNYQASLELLSNIINLREDIASIFILDKEGISFYKSHFKDIDTSINYVGQSWYQAAVSGNNHSIIFGPNHVMYNQVDHFVFSIARSIERFDGLGDLGVVLVDTNLSIIQKYCDSAKLSETSFIMVTDQSGNPVYSSSDFINLKEGSEGASTEFSLNLMKHASIGSKSGHFIAEINKDAYQIVFNTVEKTGWIVATVTPYSSLLADANEVRNYIIYVGIITFVVILLITYFISTRITTPIEQLKNIMDTANDDHLDIFVDIKARDEIGALATSFNHLIVRIKTLMQQLVSEQEEKRKAELKALQDQINPHFLYNTLDSIIWMAESRDENTVPMIEALSNLFRLSLSKGQELIPIKDELAHIKNYLFILSMRYYERFDFEIHCDPLVSSCKTPKLILQPLIENAIYHGIKNKETKGHIVIEANMEATRIVISISDDGIGMDLETCKRLLDDVPSVESTEGSGIGVRNVDQRIKLYFGKEYGLDFESTVGSGTTSYIYLPIQH